MLVYTGIVINGSTEICPLKTLLTLHSSSEQGYSEVRGDGNGAGFPRLAVCGMVAGRFNRYGR